MFLHKSGPRCIVVSVHAVLVSVAAIFVVVYYFIRFPRIIYVTGGRGGREYYQIYHHVYHKTYWNHCKYLPARALFITFPMVPRFSKTLKLLRTTDDRNTYAVQYAIYKFTNISIHLRKRFLSRFTNKVHFRKQTPFFSFNYRKL